MAKPAITKPKARPRRKTPKRKADQPKRGPLPWEPTEDERRLVEHCVAIGMRQEEVALVLDKSVDSLSRHCRKELDAGAFKANAKIGAKLFDKAMKGDSACIIFWAKTRMGFAEKTKLEHSFDLSKLTDEELEQLERIRGRLT